MREYSFSIWKLYPVQHFLWVRPSMFSPQSQAQNPQSSESSGWLESRNKTPGENADQVQLGPSPFRCCAFLARLLAPLRLMRLPPTEFSSGTSSVLDCFPFLLSVKFPPHRDYRSSSASWRWLWLTVYRHAYPGQIYWLIDTWLPLTFHYQFSPSCFQVYLSIKIF